ncbi:MAG: trypsin-like peptidase domain-containing protein [Oscillospiraceae bacterium]|nr:trypsin-like peptidase domain-containing protein [Oscillospiraceae bacterium]
MIKKLIKRITTVTVAAAILVSLSAVAIAAPSGFANFVYLDAFDEGKFNDVRADDWFKPYVRSAVNFGFFRGRGENTFDPEGLLTLGEAVVLASRLRSIYHTGSADFAESVPFYAAYVEYAISHGIISRRRNFVEPATRAEFAAIMYNALPADAFAVLNEIPKFGIIDVAYGTDVGAAVYALYRAGILTGSDRNGSFFGGSNISRAEASAIMVRLAAPLSRVSFSLPSQIPVEELFLRSTDAVFMIETFDEYDESIRTGSGFFISGEGLAVTALHVVSFSSSATIELFSGEVLQVAGIRAVNEEFNLAIIEIDSDKTDWDYLTLADSDIVEVGNTVFAIGSPRSLINTISEGIIAHTSRELDVEAMIQFTAPISFGSGGGPILNSLGQVVGVASSSFTYGQNLNLAIPVNLIRELELGPLITLAQYWEALLARGA